MVRVKLFANLREIVKTSELTVEARTPMELLSELVKQFPDLKKYLFKDGDVSDYIRVAVNGKIVDDLEVELKEDDVVAILPPFSGG